MAAIATTATANGVGGTSRTCNAPASIATGDGLLCVITNLHDNNSGAAAITSPDVGGAGEWTRVADQNHDYGYYAVFVRTATSADESATTYTFPHNGSDTPQNWIMAIVRVSDFGGWGSLASQLNGAASGSSGSTGNHVCPSQTTPADLALLITFVCDSSGYQATSAYNPPGGHTEAIDIRNGSSPYVNYCGLALGSEEIATASSTGTRTWTTGIATHGYGFSIYALDFVPGGGETLTPDAIGLASVLPAGSLLLGGISALPDATVLQSVLPAPTVSTGANSVSPDVVDAAVAVQQPSLSLGGISPAPDQVDLQSVLPSQSVLFGNSVQPDTKVVATAIQREGSIEFFGNDAGTGSFVDRVIIPRNNGQPCNVGDDFTIDVWLRTKEGNDAAAITAGENYNWVNGNIFFDCDRLSQAPGFGLSLGAGRIAFGVNGSTDRTIVGTTDIRDGEWHHISATRNGTTGAMAIYVDGVQEAADTGPTDNLSYQVPPSDNVGGDYDGYIVIGAEKHDFDIETFPSFYGYMDELRISNSVRQTSGFTPPSSPYGMDANTVALYHFDEATGLSVYDQNNNLSMGTISQGSAGPQRSADSPLDTGYSVLTGGVSSAPDAVVLQSVQPAPTLSSGASTLIPDENVTQAVQPAPTLVAGGISAQPDTAQLQSALPGGTLSLGGISTSPGVIEIVVDLPAPELTVPGLALPNAVQLQSVINQPTAQPGGISVSPDTLIVLADVLAPVIGIGGVSMAPDAMDIQALMQAPVLQIGGLSLSPDVVTISVVQPVPGVGSGFQLSPDAVVIQTSVPAPALSADGTVTPAVLSLLARINQALVDSGYRIPVEDVVLLFERDNRVLVVIEDRSVLVVQADGTITLV
jgi:hypothetical protein